MNEAGKTCPNCKKDVGIRVLLPDVALNCPHCRTKLKYSPTGVGLFSLPLLAYFGVATLVIYLTSDLWIGKMSARASMIFWGAMGCCMWIPFGLSASFHLRKKSMLELKKS